MGVFCQNSQSFHLLLWLCRKIMIAFREALSKPEAFILYWGRKETVTAATRRPRCLRISRKAARQRIGQGVFSSHEEFINLLSSLHPRHPCRLKVGKRNVLTAAKRLKWNLKSWR